MLIKRIYLENFRMYKQQEIVFSTDPDKKMTVILGDNTYGKTTLVNAFIWCLYGENRFTQDKVLLNKDVREMMAPGSFKNVRVTIELSHGNYDYKIITSETYRKKPSGPEVTVTSKVSTSVYRTDKITHNTTTIPDNRVTYEIDSILRSELKDYFFFDGENNKVQNVVGKKNLKDAVLDIMNIRYVKDIQALFNPYSNDSVYANFQRKLGKKQESLFDDDDIETKLEQEKEKYKNTKQEYDDTSEEVRRLNQQRQEREDELSEVRDIIELNEKKKSLEADLEKCKGDLTPTFNNCINVLNTGNPLLMILFSKSYNKFGMEELLNSASFGTDKSYIGINEDGVDFLLRRHECVCGAKIDDRSDIYYHLIEQKQFMEPHDYGKYVMNFIGPENNNVSVSPMLRQNLTTSARQVSELLQKTDDIEFELKQTKNKISGDTDYGYLQKEINSISEKIGSCNESLTYLDKSLQTIQTNIDNLTKSLEKQIVNDSKNAFTQKCLDYTFYIYQSASEKIEKSNTEIRDGLTQEVQDVFDLVFHGEHRAVSIDDNFNIRTNLVGDYLTKGTSTGLDIVTNFSFVVGLMNLAKNYLKKKQKDYFDDEDYVDNTYPLVLDAPFSDLDLTHIRNLCDVFARYCNQAIIVVMEKDFNHADYQINSHIGKLYKINQLSATNSVIEEVKK